MATVLPRSLSKTPTTSAMNVSDDIRAHRVGGLPIRQTLTDLENGDQSEPKTGRRLASVACNRHAIRAAMVILLSFRSQNIIHPPCQFTNRYVANITPWFIFLIIRTLTGWDRLMSEALVEADCWAAGGSRPYNP